MYHCEDCSTEIENSQIDDTDFEFIRTADGYKTKYHQRCAVCNGELIAGFSPEQVNIGLDGDPQQFYSYELGMKIESPQHLKKVLRKRGMVTLTDSSEHRERMEDLHQQAREGKFKTNEEKEKE